MHVALAGPIAGDDVRDYLSGGQGPIPVGYAGAPLTGILIGELLRMGHRVTGITTDTSLPLAGGLVRRHGPGFSFVVCPARPHAWRFNDRHLGRALDLFAFERHSLGRAMADAAPDIVHAHWSYEFALAAIDQSAPSLITCHDSPAVVLKYTRSPYRAVRYLMARNVFRRAREFSTVSDYMARELTPLIGHPPQVIPNPVAAHVLALGRPRLASTSRRVAMVCNGWSRLKNPEPALLAFAQWRSIEAAAELHLFGADFGPGETASRWAASRGVAAGMHFHGRLPHRQLAAALAAADALLHPALEESFGVVLAEAMALGLPVLAGRHSGAVPWVLGADAAGRCATGLLVDVSSVLDIAVALPRLFDVDYPSRSASGIERAHRLFAPASVAGAYEAQYRRLLSGALVQIEPAIRLSANEKAAR